MASFRATFNKEVVAPKFAVGGRYPHGATFIFDAKSLKAAHRIFRATAAQQFGVDLDDADYSLTPSFITRSDMGFLDNPNPPRVLERPGRCGTEDPS